MIRVFRNSEEDRRIFESLNINPHDLINDHHDYSKEVVDKPWGYEYQIFANEEVSIWILYLKPNSCTSSHCHPNKDTVLITLQGFVLCGNFKEVFGICEGDKVLIKKGVFHRTHTLMNEAFIMEIETPNNKNDLVRYQDLYGRV